MRKTLTGIAVAGLVMALTACGGQAKSTGPNIHSNYGATVGIAMPTRTSPRWIADGNNMVQQFSEMGYKVNLQFADNDVKKQVGQVQSMIGGGDKLLVIAAVDGSSMTSVLSTAAQKKIPVIAYDRLLTGTKDVDYQATFDNLRVGTMQGSLLVQRLGLVSSKADQHKIGGVGSKAATPTTKAAATVAPIAPAGAVAAKGPFNVELFAGSPTDNNSKFFYQGAMAVLKPYIKSGKIVIRSGEQELKQITTTNWDGVVAGTRMQKILTQDYQRSTVNAILSPYDGMSIGIIKVLLANGYGTSVKPLPIISGQDAELPSVKSIIAGQQTGTIYKDTRELAKVAVQMGNALLTGVTPKVNDTTSFNNGVKIVPTYLLPPINIDKNNYKTLLVGGGYYTAAQLA